MQLRSMYGERICRTGLLGRAAIMIFIGTARNARIASG